MALKLDRGLTNNLTMVDKYTKFLKAIFSDDFDDVTFDFDNCSLDLFEENAHMYLKHMKLESSKGSHQENCCAAYNPAG